MSEKIELELIEEYVYANEKRVRFKIKGTNIIVNVSAETLEEGVRKALQLIRNLKVVERLKELHGGAAGI